MQRTLLNLIIDLAAAVFFLAMIATGYLLRFSLPPGTNKSLSLWGLSRHQWGEVHFWISLALLSVLVVHLILHWQWLVTVIRQRLHRAKRQTSYAGWIMGFVTVGLFAIFAWAAQFSVRDRSDPCCDDAGTNQTTHLQEPTSATIPETTAKPPSPDFWKEVYPILERSCLACHGPKKAKGDFRVDRKEDFLLPRDGKAWVVPGRSDQSPFILVVSGARKDIAFPDRHKLSDSEVTVLKTWIDAGAHWPLQSDTK